jgi:hypothetical protein
VCLAGSTDQDDAQACLRQALDGFTRAQTPMELAHTRHRARLERRRPLAPEVAIAEARAALDAYERLEAARQVDAAAALMRSLAVVGRPRPGRPRTRLTQREDEVLGSHRPGNVETPNCRNGSISAGRPSNITSETSWPSWACTTRAEARRYAARRKLGSQ